MSRSLLPRQKGDAAKFDKRKEPLDDREERLEGITILGALFLKNAENETSMQSYLWVAIGGALGTTGRYWLSGVVARTIGETFPWGTLLVNVTGSFIIGFFAALTGPDGRVYLGSVARQFFMIGICGGYTTFSSFSLQTLNLANDGEWFRAGGNIVGSVVLCLVAVWAGALLANTINALKWS